MLSGSVSSHARQRVRSDRGSGRSRRTRSQQDALPARSAGSAGIGACRDGDAARLHHAIWPDVANGFGCILEVCPGAFATSESLSC